MLALLAARADFAQPPFQTMSARHLQPPSEVVYAFRMNKRIAAYRQNTAGIQRLLPTDWLELSGGITAKYGYL